MLFGNQKKKLRLPQGPRPLPIIGNMHQLGDDSHTFLWDQAKKYGPIMYLRLGSQGLVVASSADAAREFFTVQDKVWAGREHITGQALLTYNHLNIGGAPFGPYWRHLRKICTMELFTSKRLESFRPPRTDEFNQMIKSIMDDVEQGKTVDLAMKLSHAAMNNMTRMLLNKRFYGVDASAQQEAYKFKELTYNLFKLAATRSIGDFVPWLKWVIVVSGLKSRMMKVKAKADVVLQEFLEVKKNGRSIDVKNDDVHCEDFIDVLMAQPAVDGTGNLSENSIKAVIHDMLVGGTDTSSNTLEWAIAELVRHPHCAKKLQAELDEVVGRERIVTESDIPNLPYLNAVVKEALRLYPPAPLSITHVALEDTTVGGFDFVAGTRLSVNIYAIQRDPKWWERPLEFDPERFMKNPEINPLGSHFQFIPFGTGRRQCPGLILGLLFVQIGLARLMQSFDFALPNGQDPATLDMTEKFGGMDMLTYNHLDIVAAPYGPYWLHLRKICTMELFSTKRLESFRPPRTDEFNQMITSIMDDVEQGKIVDLAVKLGHVAMNNITRMLLNKRFYGLDPSAQHQAYKFKELNFDLANLASTRSIGDFVPWLKWVIIVSGLKSRMMKVKARADVLLQEFLEVKKSRKIINVKNDDVHCEDFVDVLMAQPAQDGTGHLSDNSIKAVILDMLVAGTDTSANTVEWAIAELLRHPHCAKKLQAELDEVVGKDRIVTESDIPDLPYLNAVLKEVLRLHPPVPLSITHVALEDTTVGGFDFVAGTRLSVNIYAIQRDPKWWERPLEFDPERFMKNPEINPLGSHFQFIPFGTGRRQCPGLMLGLLFKLRLPQGPRSLPIIGNIHQLGNNAHTFLWKEAKKYGPIMYLRLGSEGLVVASSAEVALEFLKVQDKVWAGRESSTGMDMFTYNHLDIVGAPYGPYWLHLRKICTMELFTTKRLESFRPPRTDEFNQMIKSIMDDVEQGKIVDLAVKLGHVAMNNITRMLLNKRFYGLDASAQHQAYKFQELTSDLPNLATTRSMGDFVPWLKWVIIVSGLKSRMMKVKARADVLLQEFLEVKKNRKIINVKNDDVHYEDFVDVLMAQPAQDGTGHLSDNSIKAVILDMLVAGTDTVSITLEWAIAELLCHPHCAKELQAELDEVVGKDRIVTESDIPNLPYLNAVLKEVLRLYPPLPLNVTHVALEDTTVGGFDFVAGCLQVSVAQIFV
ncbi:unnamed protein product [Sphagnum troendelagicum]